MTGSPHPPIGAVRDAVARALAEDLTPMGDLTASLVDPGVRVSAAVVARQQGVLAGTACVDETCRQVDDELTATWEGFFEGAAVRQGDIVGYLGGRLASVLTAERTALNFLCHLSGVATLTSKFVAAVAGTGVRILDTRKTTPGLRALEKAAVRAGGGHNHRGSLSEMVLVKDNHRAGLSIADAVKQARDAWPARTVEVECDSLEQVVEAIEAGAQMIMLDNFAADDIAAAVELVGGRALVEVSGRMNLETVRTYAAGRPDFISVGALTHSAPVFDFGLDLEIR
ncbi:MAG TPA: carboxylating nicotinate-nucleotide diphosphorylase [Acidimicrobiales bacterium]|nr:carboxylating nicotinate-nucleotide diphosphorylase [Acidimicrobiales bacterium]